MSHDSDMLATQTSVQRGAFSFETGLLATVMQAARAHDGLVRVMLEGVAEITIDAGRGRYHAVVDDWQAFCMAPSSKLRTTWQHTIAPYDERWRDLSELLWIVGYHSSGGRLPVEINRHTVVKLTHWPNLSRLPRTPDMYRLCALLARRPSSLHLAGKLLGVDEAQIFRFFCAAHASGAIELVTRTNGLHAVDTAEEPQPMPNSEASLGIMLRHLWNKMTGR